MALVIYTPIDSLRCVEAAPQKINSTLGVSRRLKDNLLVFPRAVRCDLWGHKGSKILLPNSPVAQQKGNLEAFISALLICIG